MVLIILMKIGYSAVIVWVAAMVALAAPRVGRQDQMQVRTDLDGVHVGRRVRQQVAQLVRGHQAPAQPGDDRTGGEVFSGEQSDALDRRRPDRD